MLWLLTGPGTVLPQSLTIRDQFLQYTSKLLHQVNDHFLNPYFWIFVRIQKYKFPHKTSAGLLVALHTIFPFKMILYEALSIAFVLPTHGACTLSIQNQWQSQKKICIVGLDNGDLGVFSAIDILLYLCAIFMY